MLDLWVDLRKTAWYITIVYFVYFTSHPFMSALDYKLFWCVVSNNALTDFFCCCCCFRYVLEGNKEEILIFIITLEFYSLS